MKDTSYEAVMARRNEIMKQSVGIDYAQYEFGKIGFDYERMMKDVGLSIDEVIQIQRDYGVGHTPLKELRNLTRLVRKLSPKGKGARIFIKDEALNDSGSFKARRAAISCYQAKRLGFKGVLTATSGNYGAAVASQAAKHGLKCIVVQECYDGRGIGQPEIIEKARKCEAYGAEVIQLTVGPELFYTFLRLLEETGYFNASLYTPFGILGIETLGYELIEQSKAQLGRLPDKVIVTNAGGGNLTGTARGIQRATDQKVEIVAASVNLSGLHMASDQAFNRKSFTTGHTGFGVPFSTYPDRSDVPRSAARPLRYLDRYVTINQGEVFFMTEAMTALEGIERGPAGNTSLTAAFSLAQEMDEDQVIIVQETEYTGAGKHHQAQLSFAREHGIDIRFGNPIDEIPGESIILPEHPRLIQVRDLNLNQLKESNIKNHIKNRHVESITNDDVTFLMEEVRENEEYVLDVLQKLAVNVEDK